MSEEDDSRKEGSDEELSLDFIWDEDEDEACSEAEESNAEFEAQIKNEAALTFLQTLQNAQRVAVTAERKNDRRRKCPKPYTGNSIWSKQRWVQKWRKMAENGVKFITHFFGAKNMHQQKEGISSDSEEVTQPTKKVSLQLTALNL